MRELTGKRALVTGGARRLGREIALHLAREGCDVAIHFNQSAEEAQKTVAEIIALGRNAFAIQCDLSLPDAPHTVRDLYSKHWDSLDILINSASPWVSPESLTASQGLLEATLEDWELALTVNARAPFFLIQALTPLLQNGRLQNGDLGAGEAGTVLNIVDESVSIPYLDRACHTVGKAALASITKLAAMTLGPLIQVNALELGAILPPDEISPEEQKLLRWGGPEEVTSAVSYILKSQFINGEVVRLVGHRALMALRK